MKNCYKRLISLLFVAVLCVSISSSAFAEPAWLTRAKAGIAAISLATNLVLEPVDAFMGNPRSTAVDPLGIVSVINDTAWSDYLDQSVLQVKKDVVTIDGVQYSDILLGPEAAQALRLSGLDFISAYNIANNQSEAVTYATGGGYVGSEPYYIYPNGNGYTAAFYSGLPVNAPFGLGTFVSGGTGPYEVYYVVDQSHQAYLYTGYAGASFRLQVNPSTLMYSPEWSQGGSYSSGFGTFSGATREPFSFDYTSGVIDAPLADDDWLQIRVPTSFTDPSTGTGYDINDVVTDYPQLVDGKDIVIDPDLNPDFQTDIDIGDTIGDLINTILNLLDLLPDGVDFNITKNVEPQPEPEPAPVPDPEDIPDIRPEPVDPENPGTIADTNWNFLSNLLRWIQSTIDNFRIATANALHNIFETLQDVLQSLESLPETILQAIEEGPIKLFRKALDILKDIFAPIFLLLKNALGIWHYVVDWITSISAPFTWILGIVSGTSSYITLPIYASIAGVIVIAVYRRFGR